MPLQVPGVSVKLRYPVSSGYQHKYRTVSLGPLTIVRSVNSANKFHISSVTNSRLRHDTVQIDQMAGAHFG